MHKKQIRNRLIKEQIFGFSALIVLVWLDDIFDLPQLLGTTERSVMLIQTIIVTLLCIGLGTLLAVQTHRIVKRLQQLEGFLPVCAFCKKIRVEDKWVPIESYISDHSEALFSHTFCPECGKANYGDLLK